MMVAPRSAAIPIINPSASAASQPSAPTSPLPSSLDQQQQEQQQQQQLQPTFSDQVAFPPLPTAGQASASTSAHARSDSITRAKSNKLCRNIALYGSCKFESKGCVFRHDQSAEGTSDMGAWSNTLSRPGTPSQLPQPRSAPSSPRPNLGGSKGLHNLANAPVFVPKGAASARAENDAAGNALSPRNADLNLSNPARASSPLRRTTDLYATLGDEDPGGGGGGGGGNGDSGMYMAGSDPNDVFGDAELGVTIPPRAAPSSTAAPFYPSSTAAQTNPYLSQVPHGQDMHDAGGYQYGMYDGMDQYQYGGMGGMPGAKMENFIRQPLQYHLYAPSLPHVSHGRLLSPHQQATERFFMPENLREELLRRNEKIWETPAGATLEIVRAEGKMVGSYFGLLPLDSNSPGDRHTNRDVQARVFGLPTWVYKAGNEKDGMMYALRRVEGFRLSQPEAISTIESWRRISHPNVVGVKEAFTTKAFGDQSIVFVYDYHPGSTTLLYQHLTPKPPVMRNGRMAPQQTQVTEQVLWSYIIQLANAMLAVHSAGLALRTLDPSKVILTGKNQIRLSACGILDVLAYDPRPNIAGLQAEDFVQFGKLIIALANNSVYSVSNIIKAIDHMSRQYSHALNDFVLFLIKKPSPEKTAQKMMEKLAPRVFEELTAAMSGVDLYEDALMRELENARLVRLLCKFGFINERPEFDHDARWAETGDRYLIKLFRDHVFHQVDEQGNPVVDLSHVLTCLNKLDAGVEEKVMLVSRDEHSCLIVSYRDVKACIEQAFRDLSRSRTGM